jgi:4-hydroxy-tetrahydrodipicolinate synthase
VYPAICTPFARDDDAVDFEAQRRLVRFALDCGSHGVVAFGLAGEVLKLAPDERRELTDVIVDEVGGLVPVFVGVGAPSTRASIELARHAEQAGADCVVVPAPLSGALADGALVDYFVRIA